MPSLGDIYSSAASVAQQTGVDPAIIAAIAKTEGPTSGGSQLSLGITTGAPSGKGSSGGSLPSASSEAGQPPRFWSYSSGAEASQAFASYIKSVFPAAASALGDATSFFKAMIGTNYDVVYNIPGNPSSGRNTAAETAYWNQHIASAQQIKGQYGGLAMPILPTPGQAQGQGQAQVQPSTTVEPGTQPSTGSSGGGTSSGSSPTFSDSLLHLLVTIGLVVAAIVLAILGAMFMTGHEVEQQVEQHPEAARAAAEVAA